MDAEPKTLQAGMEWVLNVLFLSTRGDEPLKAASFSGEDTEGAWTVRTGDGERAKRAEANHQPLFNAPVASGL
jgi:hypothetical protein